MKFMIGIVGILMLLYFSSSAFSEGVGGSKEAKNTFVYDGHNKRDPFRGLVSQNGQIINRETDFVIDDLNLEGIMAGHGGRNIAIINGKILKVNDEIGEFKVVQIELDYVVMFKDQQKFELKLKKGE